MQFKKIGTQAIINKLQILPVYFPHGRGDMPGKVPDKFRQSLKINEDDFENLKNCPLNKEDYIEILKEKGLIQ